MSRRDEWLGAQLRRLDVPEHAPSFFPGLERRLEEEASRRRTSGRGPAWRRTPALLTATAAAAALVLVVLAVLPGRDGGPPLRPGPGPQIQLITASEVRTRVASALSSLRTLQGEVALTCAVPVGECYPPEGGGRTTLQWSFRVTAAGDERVSAIGRDDEVSYSAEHREQRVLNSAFEPPVQVRTGLPPGPPDSTARPSVLRRDVAATVRAFLAARSEVPVGEVVEDGRPAWRLVTPAEPNPLAGPGRSGDAMEIVVDRHTGFPLRIVETLEGRFLYELRFSGLVVDETLDPGLFVLDLPPGVEPFRQDAGFRALDLAGLAPAVSYRPVLPALESLPPGFRLAEITVAARARPTGTEAGNPPSREVVSVAYRRGFDRIVVTTRATGSVPSCESVAPGPGASPCWADPLASGEGFVDERQRLRIDGGELAGAQAELVLSPRGVPHLWSIDDRLVVTVAGDATAAELQRMASSFVPVG